MVQKGILAALCSMSLTVPAWADENSGLYLGAGLGDFSTEIRELDDVDLDFDEDSDASRIFAGWRFNRVIAAQLDYFDFGDSSAATNLLEIEADAKGVAPSLVATLPLGPIELFVKGGWLFYDLEVSADGDEIFDESENDPMYGAGIGLTLLERLALRAEYEVIDISEIEDAEAVWITAAWRF
ncbi:MAG TPA: porin family protein [Gammaproteobacteria bacterium]